MKKSTWFKIFTTLCIVCAFALAGCGGGDSSTPTADVPAIDDPVMPEPGGDPVEVTLTPEENADGLWSLWRVTKAYHHYFVRANEDEAFIFENFYFYFDGEELLSVS